MPTRNNTHPAPAPAITRPQHYAMTKSVRAIVADLNSAHGWLMFAALAAFVASSIFVVKYMAGSLTPADWTGEQWLNAAIAIGITALITAAQTYLYAAGLKGAAAALATFVVVFFGLFSEISQSMEREDHTVRERSEQSGVYQAAIRNIERAGTTTPALSSASQSALAAAQAEAGRIQAEIDNKNACNSCVKTAFRDLRAALAAAARNRKPSK